MPLLLSVLEDYRQVSCQLEMTLREELKYCVNRGLATTFLSTGNSHG